MEEKGENEKEKEENECSATRIFTRKGVSVIYRKSLPYSCGFVASLQETFCESYYSRERTRVACKEIESSRKPLLARLINISIIYKSLSRKKNLIFMTIIAYYHIRSFIFIVIAK